MQNSTRQAAKAVLKGAALAALLSGALAGNAAAEDAKIKSASFSIQPVYQGDEIVVTSSDGAKWDTISSKALKLSANMLVDTKHPGYVAQIGILLGGCHNTGCYNNPVMYYESVSSRDINVNRVFDFPGNKIPVSTSGVAVPSYGDEILSACNNHLQADGATKTYSFNKLMTASFSANTRKDHVTLPPAEVHAGPGYPDYNGGDVTRQAQFAVKVTCKAHAFQVKSVDLNVSVNPAEPGQQGSCPAKGMVAVSIPTNREGPVKFQLYRNDGAKQTVVAQSKKVSNDASGKSFRVYWTKDYDLKKSIDRKYMVVVIGHKFSTPWKPMVLKCGAQHDAGGPGGKADKPNPSHGKPSGGKVTTKPPKRSTPPQIKVAPLPKLVCLGGKVSKRRCFCPPRTKKVKIGKHAYRCQVNVVKPKSPPKRVIMTAPVRQTAPKRAAPKRAAPKRAAPKRAAPKRAAPKRAIPTLRRSSSRAR